MVRKEVIEYLKTEEDIEWLGALNRFLGSHIEFLKAMKEIEKESNEQTSDSKNYNNSDNPMTKKEYENHCKNSKKCTF